MNVLITLTIVATVCMFAGIFRYRSVLMPMSALGLITALVLAIYSWNQNTVFFGMMRMDNYAIAFSTLCIIGTLVILMFIPLLSEKNDSHTPEIFSLLIFALTGAIVLVSFTNLLMLFLGIEILSLSLYVLVGVRKKDILSNEASIKYFLMGAFSTGFLLFGITLIYGATGSFDTSAISYNLSMAESKSTLAISGLLLILIGLLFKVSAFPFQFWTPDVYQGSPTIITGFMATVGKVASFAAFLRLFQLSFSSMQDSFEMIIWIVAALTMTFGNIVAIYQKSTKRMLAYSSIAHAGYMLLALLVLNTSSNNAILFYSVAYLLASLTAFAIVAIMQRNKNSDETSVFNGLFQSNRWLAVALAISMFSLAGIPPLAGFFAKFYVFSSAMQSEMIWLLIIAIINSFISVYYYFRPVIAAFMKKESDGVLVVRFEFMIILLLLSALTLCIGLFPGLVAGII